MASIRKLNPKDPKSKWVVEYTDGAGRRRRETPKSGLKRDADALRQKIEQQAAEGNLPRTPTAMSLADLAALFFTHTEQRVADGRIGKSRALNIRRYITTCVLPTLGSRRVGAVTYLDIEQLYAALCKTLSPVTARSRIEEFRLMEQFAVKRGIMRTRPVEDALRDMRGITAAPVPTFTQEEIGTLLSTLEMQLGAMPIRSQDALRCFVHLGAFCGLRIGEIIGLKVENIDFAARTIDVRHSYSEIEGLKAPKTRAGVRQLSLPAVLVDELRAFQQAHHIGNPLGLLFTNLNGSPIVHKDFWKNWWRPLLVRAGLDRGKDTPHFHSLRHFNASWLIADGRVSLPQVARLLGHANASVTLSTYAHVIAGTEKRAEIAEQMAAGLLENRSATRRKSVSDQQAAVNA